MRVILVSVGTIGDTLPYIGLGKILRSRDHEVIFLGSDAFRSRVEQAGLDFVPLLSVAEHERHARQRDLWGDTKLALREGIENLLQHTAPTFRAISERIEPGNTVVVASGLMFGAHIAQEKLAFPLATIHLQPWCFRAERDDCYWPRWTPTFVARTVTNMIDFMVDRSIGSRLNAFRAQLGLPAKNRIVKYWESLESLKFGLFPEFLAPTPAEWPSKVRFVGFPNYDDSLAVTQDTAEAERLRAYLAAGSRPIVFTPTSAVRNVRHFLEVSVEVARRADLRAIVLWPDKEQLPGNLPAGVAHFNYVPHDSLFPHAAAVVHNGGIGTCAAALKAGVPQLVVPLILDQPDNALRLRRIGVADSITLRDYRPALVAKKLSRLLQTNRIRKEYNDYAVRSAASRAFETIAYALENLLPSARPERTLEETCVPSALRS
jgi:rhamnosyltransferase subunit B